MNQVTKITVNDTEPTIIVDWLGYQQTIIKLDADNKSLHINVNGMPLCSITAVSRTAPMGVLPCGECGGCLYEGDCEHPVS